MKLIKNSGNDRVINELKACLTPNGMLDIASPSFSLFAYGELRDHLSTVAECRLVLPGEGITDLALTGSIEDRAFRNRLQSRWLAAQLSEWIEKKTQVKLTSGIIPQSTIITRNSALKPNRVITGNCTFSTEGLGITPGNQFGLIQSSENPDECTMLATWFSNLWDSLPSQLSYKSSLLNALNTLKSHRQPSLVYFSILFNIFRELGDELDEDRIVKSATGIRETTVWKKLYKFQRDGVIGAINKLEHHGGCIIADSVGLGKTFEALAIIKYYELRNDRVLVLAPKRLRDNWILYKSNDRRNILSVDRFNYDVINHTDLSRDGGLSGDINLSHVNWGNYDLVVIDESHNFRNKNNSNDHETRYSRLMRRIIQNGVKTRVLMLSATPVNNRLSDLKNQIAFITEGCDIALQTSGISSINNTIKQAQIQFNRWLALDDIDRKPVTLIDMLGFDYFKLLDLLTIARSRKHIEKYYGTAETGKFPERLKPINIKSDVDRSCKFNSIRDINNEIRRLNLSAYAPLRYVLPHKQADYDAKYRVELQGGRSYFNQRDREESLTHLLRINILKRMESSVTSFAQTIKRQLKDVDLMLARIEAHDESLDEISIDDIDMDDPAFESMTIGRKVKVLIHDVDRTRWRQDLLEDRGRLDTLYSAAMQVDASRDAKLEYLRQVILNKCHNPINHDNRKIIIFTAFADTADYLYQELSGWAQQQLGIHSAKITGTSGNKTTLPKLHTDLGSVLAAFAPLSKERPANFGEDGNIDLLIATDCISEGQNLQDCDYLVNYDIHWNPVRIIQRFGRIDRIGSPNKRIQLVNFWPNLELEEYINLEQRVSGKMVLLDISATGEENLIEKESGDQMNDLEYRRKQLLKLQDAVIDLEDLSSGVSIADLTLNDFRIDLLSFLKEHPGELEALPIGTYAVTHSQTVGDSSIPPGVIFCLRAEGEAARNAIEPGYALAPHFLIHVSDDGTTLLPYSQAKQALDRLQKLCVGRDFPDAGACARFDKATRDGRDMAQAQDMLATAVASIVGKKEERSVASLFTPGGTHASKSEFAGINDFEVVAFLVVLPELPSS